MFLKQSTSAVVIVGQVLDASGNPVTTAVIGDFTLTKNGTSATMSGNTISHSHNGHYAITLTTANTDTVGRLAITVNNASYAMAAFRWDVCQPTVFDALFANATNATGGLVTATGSVTALAGAISTYAGGDTAGTTTLLTRLPSAISLAAGAVTVGTNNDKTGYSLTAGTGLGNQTANITGNLSGSVGSVTGAVGSVTARVTANTDQWGGVGVTGMPMPTYTQPTGFLAATFPATVSSFAGGAVASVSGSVGSISGVTFPTNFGVLGINSSGHVSRVTLVDTTTANTDMRGTDNAALASAWTATRAGYLDSVVLAANNNQRTVQITGSQHIAADVHEMQTDVIDADAVAASAVTELQAGLATAANLLIVSDRVSYSLAVLVGACSDAQTAAETYTLTIGGNTFTVDYTGLDSSGNRSTTTLSKT
jgi:hypothetical protein